MEVIGHDGVRIQLNGGELPGQPQQRVLDHGPHLVRAERGINDFSEDALSVTSAYGDEVGTWLRAVVLRQAQRSPMRAV